MNEHELDYTSVRSRADDEADYHMTVRCACGVEFEAFSRSPREAAKQLLDRFYEHEAQASGQLRFVLAGAESP